MVITKEKVVNGSNVRRLIFFKIKIDYQTNQIITKRNLCIYNLQIVIS